MIWTDGPCLTYEGSWTYVLWHRWRESRSSVRPEGGRRRDASRERQELNVQAPERVSVEPAIDASVRVSNTHGAQPHTRNSPLLVSRDFPFIPYDGKRKITRESIYYKFPQLNLRATDIKSTPALN